MTTTLNRLDNVTAALRVANSLPELPVPTEFETLNYFPETTSHGHQLMNQLSNEFGNTLLWERTRNGDGRVVEKARHVSDLQAPPMFRVFMPVGYTG